MLATSILTVLALTAPMTPETLQPCRGESDCISSAGRESPNHFQAPLSFAPKSRPTAFRDAVSELRGQGCSVVDDAEKYIKARCGNDDVELLLREDIATFRVVAVSKGVTPPWCIEKGCINGSMAQRKKVLELGRHLGWSPIDSTNMADEGRWTPIFFNTDAVPRED